MSDVKKVITPGDYKIHALALKKDGSLWEWGDNGSGLKLSPEKLLDDITIFYRNIAVKNDGTVLAWSNRRKPYEVNIPFKMCPEIEKVSFPSEQVSMAVNDILLLIPSIEPIDGDYTNIKYSSSDEQVALVTSRGVVTAKQPGTTNITVTVDGQFTATCKVTVKESTGINEVESQHTADGNIYSLSGQRLAAPKKGINIINGRKVIVK
jgi:transglutaminase/protease-like cytokinesis protein 3